ncbi:MAG TPA: hypothetical protein VFE34_20130 [Dongiaceae bacterium]|jgi:hypothetical protein|nr:hypothetical protein [Dongiaceae bacterium]
MKYRREILLGLVAGAAGLGFVSNRAFAWYYDELTPDQAATLAAACRLRADSHARLITNARQDLLQRITKGMLPTGASEQVGCPICGCTFVVTADGTN